LEGLPTVGRTECGQASALANRSLKDGRTDSGLAEREVRPWGRGEIHEMQASQIDLEQSGDLRGCRNLLLAGSGWEPTMKIVARVSNTVSGHTLEVETDGRKQSIAIAPKTAGRGSSVNGGELLFAALATRFCNDLYREAAKRGIEVHDVNVEVTGTFGNPGEPAHAISVKRRSRAISLARTLERKN
jgi:organic hydroperoxide reductase OsmC/OhrA